MTPFVQVNGSMASLPATRWLCPGHHQLLDLNHFPLLLRLPRRYPSASSPVTLKDVLNLSNRIYKKVKTGLDNLKNVSLPVALKQELRDLGLKDADVYSIHGNVLVDNRTNGGGADSGRSGKRQIYFEP